jgi:hypothetical protein
MQIKYYIVYRKGSIVLHISGDREDFIGEYSHSEGQR